MKSFRSRKSNINQHSRRCNNTTSCRGAMISNRNTDGGGSRSAKNNEQIKTC